MPLNPNSVFHHQIKKTQKEEILLVKIAVEQQHLNIKNGLLMENIADPKAFNL